MKRILPFAALLYVFTSAIAQSSNVGIGTNTPQTKLEVAGAISSTPSSAPAANNVTIPDNVSVFRLTLTAAGSTTALSITNPKEGQYLTIYNEDDNNATFAGQTIAPLTGVMSFSYIASGWRMVSDNQVGTSNNFIKNQNAADQSAGFRISGNGSLLGAMGVGTSSPKTSLDVNGGLSLREGLVLTLANGGASGGTNDNIVLPDVSGATGVKASFYRITGPTAAFSIYGIAPVTSADGQLVTLVNTTSNAMTIKNNGSSTSANSIKTLTGADIVSVAGNSSVTFQYNKTDSKWYVTATQNFTVSAASISSKDIVPGTGSAVTVANGANQVIGGGNVILDVQTNGLNQKGIVPGPTGLNGNQGWITDPSGNPAWAPVNSAIVKKDITTSTSGVTLGNNTGQVVGASNMTIDVATNSASSAGLVPAGTGNNNKVWGTNGSGTPSWNSVSNAQLANSSVTINPGTGMSGGGTVALGGTVTVTNNAPDQTVVLNNGTGISVSGAYPNFTITNTAPSSGGTVTGSGTQNYLSKWNNAGGTSLGNSLIYDNGTYVGIGTVLPDEKFEVYNGNIKLYNTTSPNSTGIYTTNSIYLADNQYLDIASGTFKAASTGTSNRLQIDYNNGFRFFNSPSAATNAAVTSNEVMRISTAGNVGIGVTSMQVKLKVAGDIEANNQVRATGWLTGSGTGQGTEIGVSGGYSYLMGYDRTASAYSPIRVAGSSIDIRHNDASTDLYVNGSGNVGVGTNTPGQKLDVNGNVKIDANRMVEGNSSYRIYRNVATYNNSVPAAAGAFVITTSQPWNSACMFKVKIEGYFYDATAPFEINIGAYQYTGNDFYNYGYTNIGSQRLAVQLGRNNSTNTVAIILGNIGTNYSYPKIAVREFYQGHSSINESYADGWTISQVTSLSNFTYLVTVPDVTTLPTGSGNYIQNQTGSAQSAGFNISGNAYVGGNMGVGTVSPSYKFQVNGGPIATDNYFFNYNSGIGQIVLNSSGAYYGNISNPIPQAWSMGYSGGGTAIGTPVLTWNASGNVGIGTTSPSVSLHIQRSSSANYLTLENTDGTTSAAYSEMRFIAGSRSGYLWLRNQTGGGEGDGAFNVYAETGDLDLWAGATRYMTIKAAGNVGIGTTSPSVKLHVAGGGAIIGTTGAGSANRTLTVLGDNTSQISFGSYPYDWSPAIQIQNNDNTKFTWISAGGGPGYSSYNARYYTSGSGLDFYTGSNAFAATITAAGRVGIGTSSPGYQLSVYGPSGNYPAYVGSPDGYLAFGPANTGWCHFQTDRASFYFNPKVTVDGNVEPYINNSYDLGTSSKYWRTLYSGTVSSAGNIVNTIPTYGTIGLTGDLPGYGASVYPTLKTSGSYLYISVGGNYSGYWSSGGTYTVVSSKAKKDDFRELDKQDILNKINALDMKEWHYKTEAAGIKHIGPFAEDFHNKFGLNGANDSMISTTDPAGVALVGVQALSERIERLEKLVEQLTGNHTGATEFTAGAIAPENEQSFVIMDSRISPKSEIKISGLDNYEIVSKAEGSFTIKLPVGLTHQTKFSYSGKF